MRKYFFAIFLILPIYAVISLYQNGIKPFTLLDEFSPDDPALLEYLNYKKDFNSEMDLTILVENHSREKLSPNEWIKTSNFFHEKLKRIQTLKKFVTPLDWELPRFELEHKSEKLIFDSFITTSGIKEDFLKNPILLDFFVNQQSSSYLIPVTIISHQQKKSLASLEILLTEFNKTHPKQNATLLGVEYFRKALFDEILYSYKFLLPIIVTVIGFTFWFYLRNFTLIFYSILTLAVCFIFTTSLIIIVDKTLSPFSSLSLLFVFVVGTSDLIHYLIELIKNNGDAKTTVKNIITPCFYTSLTTFIGLFSLLFTPIKALNNFGIYGCTGVFVCFVVTFFILPSIRLPKNVFKKAAPNNNQKYFNIFSWGKTYPRATILIALIFSTFLLFFSTKIKFSDDFYHKFTPEHKISKSVQSFERNFPFLGSIDLIFPTKNLSKELIDDLKSIDGIATLKSSFDFKTIYGESFSYLLKDSPLSSLYYPEISIGKERIILFLKDQEIDTLFKVRDFINKKYPQYQLQGFYLLRAHFFNQLNISYQSSLIFSLITIFISFCFLLKSIKLGFIAMMPNITPILFITGIMGLFSLKADINLPILCSLALGIAVDDTIHFLYHFQKIRPKVDSTSQAISLVFNECGLAIIATTALLCISTAIFYFSHVKLFKELSMLLTGSLIIALVFDLIFLPAILIFIEKRFKIW